ncbi:MAG: nucleotidyltransferase domain-containing protein [Chloroflexota bacterium]|nr:nucleotidyltransferase domain-containing protein [Chloroflexota bacterium]
MRGRAPDKPASTADLMRYGRERDALLDRITPLLQADPRVGAAWLSGSFGRDEADEWSDLDLHVAVEDDHFPAFLRERPDLFGRAGHPILVQQDMPSDSMPGGRFQLALYAGTIEVDWNIGPISQAARPAASRVLFDRVGIPLATPPPLTPAERRAKADQ